VRSLWSRLGPGLLFAVYDWGVLVLGLLLAVVPAWLLGRYVQQRAALVEAGWERAALLERQQRLQADRARLAERARIAQDMHDSLGHEWTLIALRAAALEMSPRLDEDTRTAARGLRADVAAATEHLRDVIGVLQPDRGADLDGRLDVAALVERATAAGMTVHRDGEPEPADLPLMVRRAVHRVVQEALTNAAKHAPGALVTVRLDHTDDATTVSITNGAATSPAGTGPSGGAGIAGLRERVRLLGGTLRAGPAGPGFEVVAVLPHDGRPAAPPAGAATETQRRLERARGEVRRSALTAVRVPLLAGAAVAVLALALFRSFEWWLLRASGGQGTRRSRRSGWSCGTWTRTMRVPSGSAIHISCSPHGSCRGSRTTCGASSRWAAPRSRTCSHSATAGPAGASALPESSRNPPPRKNTVPPGNSRAIARPSTSR
jgi:hypothetical protein